ncbi:MAG: STAS domain-containing protein [Planctomycetota bacterium]
MTPTESSFVAAETIEGKCIARVRCERVTEREATILTNEITQAAAANGHRIAIDVSEILFLASAGIGTFVSIDRACRANKGKMALFGLRPEILEILKVTRLHKLFTLARSEEGALKSLS